MIKNYILNLTKKMWVWSTCEKFDSILFLFIWINWFSTNNWKRESTSSHQVNMIDNNQIWTFYRLWPEHSLTTFPLDCGSEMQTWLCVMVAQYTLRFYTGEWDYKWNFSLNEYLPDLGLLLHHWVRSRGLYAAQQRAPKSS